MIDFSKVVEVSIPEGIAIKIVSGGKVLWEKSGLLPSAYKQVEYIATDGNQYIDTGVLASNYSDGIRYVFKGNVTQYQSQTLIYWFGALASGRRSGNFFIYAGREVGFYIGGSGSVSYALDYKPEVGVDFEIVAQGTPLESNNCIVTVDGLQLSRDTALYDTAMPNTNIYLFTANGTSAVSAANRKYYGKLYGFTMDSVDGTPIRNFVPCYRKTDGVIGLFDTVGKQFYTNIGTASLTKGADVV